MASGWASAFRESIVKIHHCQWLTHWKPSREYFKSYEKIVLGSGLLIMENPG
jgi:hypothetical protein